MIGLLKKDLFLLKVQRNFLLLIIAVTFFISYNADNSFAVVYLTFLSSFQLLNCFAYDDNGGCTSFLLTLPVSRSGYVQEKYVFGLLLTSSGWIIGELIDMGMALVRGGMPQLDEIGLNLACLMGFWIFIFVTIPVVMRYGVERGRIVIFFIFAVFAGVLFFGEKVLEQINVSGAEALAQLLAGRQSLLLICVAVGTLFVMAVSYGISIRIMRRKEF